MLAAGSLRHRVTIKNPVATANDSGQVEYNYNLGISPPVIWALVEYTSQNKTTDGDVQNAGQATFLVRCRYRTDITYRTRLIFGTKELMVTGISEDTLKIETLVECEEADL